MADALTRQPGEPERLGPRALWRGFRRARWRLWIALAALAVVGAALHDALARTVWARLVWLAVIAVSIAQPLRHLLGFRCPRCSGVYLATGGLRDFLGLHRILWSRRCGSCALPAGDTGHHADRGAPCRDASDLPDSRPAPL